MSPPREPWTIKNSQVRAGLAQKADLLGAIRLPNNAFKANAGTEVTADILFFQKRDRAPGKLTEWVESGLTADGVPLNRYFPNHPEMVWGKMLFWKNMYGNEMETAKAQSVKSSKFNPHAP